MAARSQHPRRPVAQNLRIPLLLEVRDADSDEVLGKLVEVMTPPGNYVYVIRGKREYLVPAVEEFIIETNVEAGYMRVHLLEGM